MSGDCSVENAGVLQMISVFVFSLMTQGCWATVMAMDALEKPLPKMLRSVPPRGPVKEEK